MSNIETVIVLDYTSSEVVVIRYDQDKTEDVEEMLVNKLGFSKSNINWMTADNLNIKTEPGIFSDESPDFEN